MKILKFIIIHQINLNKQQKKSQQPIFYLISYTFEESMSQQQIASQILRLSSSKICSEGEDISAKCKTLGFQKKMTSNIEGPQLKKINTFSYFQKVDIKIVIKQLKDHGKIQRKKLTQLIQICQNILKFQPNVLRISSPVVVVGDIHGQFYDLLNIFQLNGYPTDKKFLFLGDYVDRGLFCIEVVTLLLVLKLKYQKNVFLLRGNHEGRVMTSNFNFRLQCQKKYGIEVYERFIDLFCKLPLCAVVDQTYFAVHGGISPQITAIKQIEKINRFSEIQNRGIICDLVWSDPSENNMIQWEPNAMRGCSYYYSKIQAKRFLKENRVKMIIRGHEVQIEGYNYQKSNNDEKLTLTIFSAPNYCDTYKNKGAVALIADNKISIHRFNEVEHPFVLSNYMNGFEFTIPGVCQLVGKILVYMLKTKRKSRRVSSFADDKILEEINAIQRIEFINKIFEQKLLENEEALLEQEMKNEQLSQELRKSYEIAFTVFSQKKQNDEEQKYPDQNVIENIRARKVTSILHLKNNKLGGLYEKPMLSQDAYEEQEEIREVFGPKLNMRNNINKRIFFQEDSEFDEKFQEQTIDQE